MNITRNRLRRLILQEMKSPEEDMAWIFGGDHSSKERKPARDEKVVYGMLEAGDLFTFEGSLYMMTDSGSDMRVVHLGSGEMTKMFRDETVILHRGVSLKMV